MQLAKNGQISFNNKSLFTYVRHEDGHATTLAIMKVEHEKPLLKDEVHELLVTSITEWVANTESGKAAWEQSSQDFNIGDLTEHLEDDDLARSLYEHGLLIRSLRTIHVGPAQTYDALLVDTDRLA